MKNAIKIQGRSINKKSVVAVTKGITTILKATLKHRSKKVTIRALEILGTTTNCSVSNVHITNSSFKDKGGGINAKKS